VASHKINGIPELALGINEFFYDLKGLRMDRKHPLWRYGTIRAFGILWICIGVLTWLLFTGKVW